MAFPKSHLYPKEDQSLCIFMKALGHPARARIIRQLAKEGTCSVKVISKNHPISRPAMSVHLRILRVAHLVKCYEDYPDTFYSLDAKNAAMAIKLVKAFLKELKLMGKDKARSKM